MKWISGLVALLSLFGFYFSALGITVFFVLVSIQLSILILSNRQNNFFFLIVLTLFPFATAANYLIFGTFSNLGVFKIEDQDLMIRAVYGFLIFSCSGYLVGKTTSIKTSNFTRFSRNGVDRMQILLLSAMIVYLISTGVVVNVLDGNYNTLVSKRTSNEFKYLYAILYWLLPMFSVLSFQATKGSIITYGMMILVIILNLLVGRRTEPIAIILVIAVISGISFTSTRMIIIVSVFIFIFPVVGIMRSTGQIESSGLKVAELLVNRTFGELALTIQTLAGTIDLIEKGIVEFRYGLDYFKGLIFTLPFGSIMFNDLATEINSLNTGCIPAGNKLFTYHFGRDGANYQQWLREGTVTGLGYSIVAEAYLQFGLLGIISIGCLAQSIWQRV